MGGSLLRSCDRGEFFVGGLCLDVLSSVLVFDVFFYCSFFLSFCVYCFLYW